MRIIRAKQLHAVAMTTTSVMLGMPPASAQSYYNPPPCPNTARQLATLSTTSSTTFSNGSAMPSCGAMLNGAPVKLVWNGSVWQIYRAPPQAAAPQPGSFPMARPNFAPTVRLPAGQVMLASQGTLNGNAVYLVAGSWYQLITNDGGTYTARLVASGAGNLVAAGAGNLNDSAIVRIVSTNGATADIMLKGGASIARYKQAVGLR